MSLWNSFENRLMITAKLVARTGIRIGMSSETALPTATDLPVMRDSEGKPFIPGSTLRGVFRSHLERIVRTFESVGPGTGACLPTGQKDDWCIQDRSGLEELTIYNNSCRICRVFGSPWFASKARFTDLKLSESVEPEIRDGVVIDREKETSANKYDFEVLPVGTNFQLELIAENLTDTEKGLLLFGVRELTQGSISVGGFKGRGLGQVTLEDLSCKYVDRKSLKSYLLTSEMIELDEQAVADFIRKFVAGLGGNDDARQVV